MRPAVEALAKRGVPAQPGSPCTCLILLGLIAGFLWLVVPRAIDQVDSRPRRYPAERARTIGEQTRNSTGIKHDVLENIQRRLVDLPTAGSLVDPALR